MTFCPGDVVRLRRGTQFMPCRRAVLAIRQDHGVSYGVVVTRTDGGTPWRAARRALWSGVCFPAEAVAEIVERDAELAPDLHARFLADRAGAAAWLLKSS